MRRSLACLFCAFTAYAQVPQRDLISEITNAYWKARGEGQFEEAAAKREEARRLGETLPPNDPQFAQRIQHVAQMYENGGFSAQARLILQDTLLRVTPLGESHPARVQLLSALAQAWQQDRHLLKAIDCLEKAIAATPETLSSIPLPPHPANGIVTAGRISPFIRAGGYGSYTDSSYLFHQLAGLYRTLGRPAAAEAVITKFRSRSGANQMTLALMYEQQGELEQAAAIYKKLGEQAGAPVGTLPWAQVSAYQSLSSLYVRQQRYDEAVAALNQALAVVKSANLPNEQQQTAWLRQAQAQILSQAGRAQAADEAFRQNIADAKASGNSSEFSMVIAFANHLAHTKRADQGEELMKDYLANHTNLQLGEESSVLYTLSHLAQSGGHPERAEEYRRAANEKQPKPSSSMISQDLYMAQSLAQEGKVDEAFDLARRALNNSSRATDRETIAGIVPSIASALSFKKAQDKAEELFLQAIDMTRDWSVDSIHSYINMLHARVGFLQQHRERVGEVPAAIELYRSALIAAHGPETGRLQSVLLMAVNHHRTSGEGREAVPAARELLALEEALGGTTSENYLFAVEIAADLFEFHGDPAEALALRRQAVTIADLISDPSDQRRCYTRMNTAHALARQEQFDEAEARAAQAVLISQKLGPPQQIESFKSQLEQIRQMKRSASGSALKQPHPFFK